MKAYHLICPSCGASISGDERNAWISCSHCGTKLYLERNQDDVIFSAKIRLAELENARRQMEIDADEREKERQVEKETKENTNNREKAKKGNSGVFAYRNSGSQTSSYYIIDFDEGYVYFFTVGSGDQSCEKVAMVSGDLNSVLIITYHDSGESWSEGLHFKWKNSPEKLIVELNGFDYEYSPTDLEEAIKLRDKLTIVER